MFNLTYYRLVYCLLVGYLLSVSLFSTNYYISNFGNNTNNGLSINTAIAEVQELITRAILQPGDSILRVCLKLGRTKSRDQVYIGILLKPSTSKLKES